MPETRLTLPRSRTDDRKTARPKDYCARCSLVGDVGLVSRSPPLSFQARIRGKRLNGVEGNRLPCGAVGRTRTKETLVQRLLRYTNRVVVAAVPTLWSVMNEAGCARLSGLRRYSRIPVRCSATICHCAFRLTYTVMYRIWLSTGLPLLAPFKIQRPVTMAVSP